MFPPQEKAECVSWFIETKSDVLIGRNQTTKYAKQVPAWHVS